MKVNHIYFEKLLMTNNITKKDFSKYAKIPYYTVAGWKKTDKVPAYAMVVLRDMIYRKLLDTKAKEQLQSNLKTMPTIPIDLTETEKKQIKSAFWGTNYSAEEIIQEVIKNNDKFIKRFDENVPKNIKDKVKSLTEAICA